MDEAVGNNVLDASSDNSNHESLVMGTAQDAVKAKCAAVVAGYYRDPYIAKFASTNRPVAPVQVIIKRGTFARSACIFKAVTSFLDLNDSAAQIIVLGSGKDTLFFRTVDEYCNRRSSESTLRWFEVDYNTILKEKTSAIQKNPRVFGASINATQPDVYELTPTDAARWPHNTTCCFVAHDLQRDAEILVRDKLIEQVGMNVNLPTLIVMECVQMYLPVQGVVALLSALTSTIMDCTLVSFEPILGAESTSDAFGRMMQENLTKAGVVRSDSCLVQTRTLSQMLAQLQSAGFARATACDMYAAYETVVPASERATAQKCEFLDELEEFILIMRHYCFVVASNHDQSISSQSLCAVGRTSDATTMGFTTGRCEELL